MTESAAGGLKTAVVCGGAGFLGSHLCDRLVADHRVICIDNFHTGRRRNVAHLSSRERLVLLEHNIVEPLSLAGENIDRIYNLASPASPVHYQSDPLRTVKTNVLGVLNLLELARHHNARFFQASTSEVYGDPLEHPQRESYWGNVNPVGVRSCYDEGKRCAETIVYDYRRQHGLEVRTVRIFNTYGPRMLADDGRVVSNFIVQALAGRDLTVYGQGTQTRSFCYVSDLIEGMVRCMEQEEFSEPINLGNPIEFTVSDLARQVIRLTGSASKLAYGSLPEDDPKRRLPDITLAQRHLNWEPAVPLEDGLRRTVSWFREAEQA